MSQKYQTDTAIIQTDAGNTKYEWKKIEITDEIRQIRMKVASGTYICGIKLINDSGDPFSEKDFGCGGVWVIQDVPKGHEIAGVFAHISTGNAYFLKFGFNLWQKDRELKI